MRRTSSGWRQLRRVAEKRRLANPPSKLRIQNPQARGATPLEIGRVLVATHEPHRVTGRDVIWELVLEAQVIDNRGAVMMLPAGVNKATGLEYALRELALSRHEVAGVGDAENDHLFLERCECAVAVANAAPSIKATADFVTAPENGNGVIELIDELIADDLRRLTGTLPQHSSRLSSSRSTWLWPSAIRRKGPSGNLLMQRTSH